MAAIAVWKLAWWAAQTQSQIPVGRKEEDYKANLGSLIKITLIVPVFLTKGH